MPGGQSVFLPRTLLFWHWGLSYISSAFYVFLKFETECQTFELPAPVRATIGCLARLLWPLHPYSSLPLGLSPDHLLCEAMAGCCLPWALLVSSTHDV